MISTSLVPWNARLPQIREIAMYFGGVDPAKEPVPVRPTVHYTMGGVSTDLDARTEAPGILAAGECACISVHGANRLAGNALTEVFAMGGVSGEAAAEALRTGAAPLDGADIASEKAGLESMLSGGKGDIRELRREAKKIMWADA